jgi:hypothetical protein
VQAAHHVRAHPGPLGAFFRQVAKRRGYNVAVVATARKLIVIAWHMLKTNEPYRYAQAQTVEYKLEQLRVTATGEKRKRGYAKGTPRPATYGSGQRVERIRSLGQVYERTALPPPKGLAALPLAEQRMLAQIIFILSCCMIAHLGDGVRVKLCSAHSYGTEMLPDLRCCLDIFSEFAACHGQSVLAAYTNTRHEARALLHKIDRERNEDGERPRNRPQIHKM